MKQFTFTQTLAGARREITVGGTTRAVRYATQLRDAYGIDRDDLVAHIELLKVGESNGSASESTLYQVEMTRTA
jgi:hypothetical protein